VQDNISMCNKFITDTLRLGHYCIIPMDVVAQTFPVKLVTLILVLAGAMRKYYPLRNYPTIKFARARASLRFTKERLEEAEHIIEKEGLQPLSALDLVLEEDQEEERIAAAGQIAEWYRRKKAEEAAKRMLAELRAARKKWEEERRAAAARRSEERRGGKECERVG
jgi:hypothetical protein